MSRLWIWGATVALTAAASPAFARVHVVAPEGTVGLSAAGGGVTTMRQAVGALQDGDTIVMTEGVYAGGLTIVNRSNITIQGEGDVVIGGAGAAAGSVRASAAVNGMSMVGVSALRLENLRYNGNSVNGLYIEDGSNVVIRNCDFSNNGKTGLLTAYLMDVTVENCTASNNRGEHGIYLGESGDRYRVVNNRMWGNTRNGLQINATPRHSSAPNRDGISTDCLVANNETWSNSQGGILLMGVHNSTFANNLIRGNRDHGIAMFDDGYGDTYGCKNNKFWHNTVIQSGGKYGLSAISGSTGNEVMNNIFITSGVPAYRLEDSLRSDYNCFQGSTGDKGNEPNSFVGTVSLTADYHPIASSPARDGGRQVYPTDKDGKLRPQGPNPDCGCYEEGSGGGGGEQPPAPSGLQAQAGDGQVALSWNASTGATGYHVYRSTSAGGTYVKLTGSPVSNTSHLDTGLTNGATYWYRVTAVNAESTESNKSSAVSATPSGGPEQPPAPNGLQAQAGDGQVALSWNASTGATGYHVYRSTSAGGTYVKLTGSPVSDTSHLDTGLTNGATYWYRVTAVNAESTESDMSSAVSATPSAGGEQPPAPSGLQAQAGNGQVALSWNASTGATGYHVYRSTSAGGTYVKLTGSPVSNTSHLDTGLTNGATYWYRVTAVNAESTESSMSSAVSATPSGGQGGGGDAIYTDALRTGWRAFRTAATTLNLGATSPVIEGSKSISLRSTSTTGYVRLAGTVVSGAGRTAVKLAVHYGAGSAQKVRIAAFVNGRQASTGVLLSSLGSTDLGNGWVEYSIPLATLRAAAGLTGLKISGDGGLTGINLDNIRVE